jgi:hypothetical protein
LKIQIPSRTKWILIGLMIRIAVMPLFAHMDLLSIGSWGLLLKEKHELPPASEDGPLIYYIFAGIYTLFGAFFPETTPIQHIYSNTAYTPTFAAGPFILAEPGINIFIFVSKIPYLVVDLLMAYLLPLFASDPERATLLSKLWLLNPVSIYISYVVGQYDIIPTFIFMLALWYFKKSMIIPSILLLGLGGAIKFFPLLFVIPLALIYLKTRKFSIQIAGTVGLVLLSIVPLIILTTVLLKITPVYYLAANAAAPGPVFTGFYGNTLYFQGSNIHPIISGLLQFTTDFSFFLSTVPFNQTIYLFFFIYILLLVYVISSKHWPFAKVWKIILLFFLAYYSLTFFLPQWYLWFQPLLVLLATENPDFMKFYVGSTVLFFPTILYFDTGLTTYLVGPIFLSAVTWPGPIEVLNSLNLPATEILNIFRTFLSAALIGLALLIIRRERLLTIK